MVAGIKVEEEIIRDLEQLGIELYVSGQKGYWACLRIEPDLISRIKEAQKEDSLPPTQRRHDAIWVIVDRLTKSAHFIPIRKDFSVSRFLRTTTFLPLYHVSYSCYLCYLMSLYPFTEHYAQPYFFSCFDTTDEMLVIPMKEIQVDDKLYFVEKLVELIDREIEQWKQSHIPIIKVAVMAHAIFELALVPDCATYLRFYYRQKTFERQKKREKTASPSIGRTLKINEMLRKKKAEIEAKRIAEEEKAAKDKEEETEDDDNVKKEVEKNVVELVNEAATKSVKELFAILESKKKPAEQLRKKTDKEAIEKEAKKTAKTNDKKRKHVEETEDNVDNMEKDVEDEEAKSSDEEANLVEEQAREQADNEEDAEENDVVNQIFNNIQTMPFMNTATRSNKNQVGKAEEESEEEKHDDEIGIETDSEDEEEMVKNIKNGQKCIKWKEPSTSKKKTINKAEKEKENYSNSKDEEELNKKGSIKATRQKVNDILDFIFKINFLTLLGSTMGTLANGGRVPKKLVICIKEETDISDIDWCGYTLDYLHDENKEKQDDIGKGTEEVGSETKNDREEVHAKFDDLNEQMKDKEADKQKYDLTDSQCEELKYQATQDIKKKKTTKRKSPEDMTPSTFSLGLTPEESEPTKKRKKNQWKKRGKDLSLLESKPKPKDKAEKAVKRAKRPSRFLVSPYLNKKTAIKGKATTDELVMTKYLFSMK
nr:peptidase C48, SUMO/sentrin/Ubl1 [Tanacetum cinerariifolium]